MRLKQIGFMMINIYKTVYCVFKTFSLLVLLQKSYWFHLCMTDKYALFVAG